jgi:hypothetical protein
MSISQFTQVIRQAGTDPNMVVGPKGDAGIEVRRPLNPPSNWTHFKAALAHVPLLGQIGSLRQARAEVDSYPLRLQEYQANNRQVLAGFIQDLKHAFGDRVASMATRDLAMSDGAPLKARSVAQVMEAVEVAQKTIRSHNNMDLVRFLESPISGGARLPGETDMNGVFLDKGFPLTDPSGWEKSLGEAGEWFVTAVFKGLCTAMPEFSKGRLDNQAVAAAAGQALDHYQDMCNALGMTPARLEGILMRAQVLDKRSANDVLQTVREAIVDERLSLVMDRRNPDSMLVSKARAVAESMGMEPPSDAVLKSIAKGNAEQIMAGSSNLHLALGCAQSLQEMMPALEMRLSANVENAVRGHLNAQTLIQGSETLLPAQKDYLLEIAQTRRIDPVQVEQYERIAQAAGQGLERLHTVVAHGSDPQALLDALGETLTRFEDGMLAMKQHGAGMWESGSIDGGEATTELMVQFSVLAASRLAPEAAQAMLPALIGEGAKRLMQGMMMSMDMRMAGQLPIIISTLVQAVAMRSGEEESAAQMIARDITRGEEPPMYALPPSLLLPVLLSSPDDIDSRGVVQGSRNGRLIQTEYTPQAVIEASRHEIVDYIGTPAVDTISGLPDVTLRDMGRAHFEVNGVVVGRSGDDAGEVLHGFQVAMGTTDRAMVTAIGRCMNQYGINLFVELNNNAAYEAGATVGLAQGSQTQYHAWAQEDGSWLIRASHTQRPAVIARPDGSMDEVQTNGAAAFSITYRVSPGVDMGAPVIELTDSSAVYAI